PQGVYGMYKLRSHQPILGTFTLGPSDAILFLGCSPPLSKYWSMRSYLMTKQGKFVFASLGDSLNHLVAEVSSGFGGKISNSVMGESRSGISTEHDNTSSDDGSGKFNKNLAVLTTGDAATYSDVKDALKWAGIDVPLNLDSLPAPLIQ